MLYVVDFIDNILNECTRSGVGTHAGEGVFSESDKAFILVSVETEMKLLIVGIEHKITAFFLHAFESQSVFEREMLDGNRAFADIKPLLAEDVIYKDVARGIIYVGCERNVGDYLTAIAGRAIFPHSIFPLSKYPGLFEDLIECLLAIEELESLAIIGYEAKDPSVVVRNVIIIVGLIRLTIADAIVIGVFEEEKTIKFVLGFGKYRFHHIVFVTNCGSDVMIVDVEKEIIHKSERA